MWGLRAELSRRLAEGAGVGEPLLLRNATLQASSLADPSAPELPAADDEGNVLADVLLCGARVAGLAAPGDPDLAARAGPGSVDLARKMVWPCFCEPHAHLAKAHGCPRCPNATGSINDAMTSEVSDRPWSYEDLERRMDFTLRAAYVHGVRVLRTHLDGSEDERPEQRAAIWAAFDTLRARWDGRVSMQGVANLFLPCWSDPAQAKRQVDEAVSRRPHVSLGAYCGLVRDRGALVHFRELFRLAAERDLPVDLHVDETSAADACGVALAMEALAEARKLGYRAPVLCGHCCAVSLLPAERAQETIRLASEASGVVVVANPLTNLWLQDRPGTPHDVGVPAQTELRTPQWRGLTLLREFQAAGVAVALGGDNVRDWWFSYGDSDPLETLRVGVLAGHLDKPHGSLADWSAAVSRVPLAAFGSAFRERALGPGGDVGIGAGLGADLVIFGARRFSELLARPQADRLVLRSGTAADGRGQLCLVDPELPDYAELDDLVDRRTSLDGGLSLPGR